MNTVLQHLQNLYMPSTSPDLRAEADAYLDRFQSSIQAWNISIEILSSSLPSAELESKIFASQTLRRKIVYDLDQLPSASERVAIKETLLQLVKIYFSPKAPSCKPVATQLAIAVVYLAVQVQEFIWPDPIATMFCLFEAGLIEREKLVEFLSIFADECKHCRITLAAAEEANAFRIQSANLVQVFTFLFTTGSSFGWNSVLLECVLFWFKYAVKSEAQTLAVITQFPIVQLAFSGIESCSLDEKCGSICCELVSESIFKASAVEALKESVPLEVFHKLRQSLPLIQRAIQEQEEQLLESFIDIYSEFSWSCEELMLCNSEVLPFLLSVILEFCTFSHSTSNWALFERTFSFWEALVKTFEERPSLLSASSPKVLQFVVLLFRATEVPSNISRRSEEMEDFEKFAVCARDILHLYASVLGIDQILCLLLQYCSATTAGSNIIQLKNAIRAVKAMAKELDTSTLFPQCLAFFHSAYQQQLLSSSERCSILSCHFLLLSKIAKWFSAQPVELLVREFGLLQSILLESSEGILLQDALIALKALLGSCEALIPAESAISWFQLLMQREAAFPMYTQIDLYGCIAAVLARIPPAISYTQYESIFAAALSPASISCSHSILEAWEKLVILMRESYSKTSQEDKSASMMIPILIANWSSVEECCTKWSSNVNVMETIARFFKYALLSTAVATPNDEKMLLSHLLPLLVRQFPLQFQSWPIYLLRVILREQLSSSSSADPKGRFFHSQREIQSCIQAIDESVWRLFNEALAAVNNSSSNLTVQPASENMLTDVLVDWFKLHSLYHSNYALATASQSQTATIVIAIESLKRFPQYLDLFDCILKYLSSVIALNAQSPKCSIISEAQLQSLWTITWHNLQHNGGIHIDTASEVLFFIVQQKNKMVQSFDFATSVYSNFGAADRDRVKERFESACCANAAEFEVFLEWYLQIAQHQGRE